jgi:hypothetical protein
MSRELLQQAYTTLLHARNFIVSKERMHPTGVDLYEKLAHEICDELAKPEQKPTVCGYDETVGMCTNNPCCEQEPVSHLWECIGRWSAYLAANGKQGNLAPPTWLVDAVKAATAPPCKTEQEPIAKHVCNLWINPETSEYEVDRCTHPINEVIPVYTAPPPQALAKPEPVALKMVYGEVCCQSKHDDQSFGMWCPITEEEFPNGTPFYTAPPRKPWVGLTDGELNLIYAEPQTHVGQYARAIEAKLKEKNS